MVSSVRDIRPLAIVVRLPYGHRVKKNTVRHPAERPTGLSGLSRRAAWKKRAFRDGRAAAGSGPAASALPAFLLVKYLRT